MSLPHALPIVRRVDTNVNVYYGMLRNGTLILLNILLTWIQSISTFLIMLWIEFPPISWNVIINLHSNTFYTYLPELDIVKDSISLSPRLAVALLCFCSAVSLITPPLPPTAYCSPTIIAGWPWELQLLSSKTQLPWVSPPKLYI